MAARQPIVGLNRLSKDLRLEMINIGIDVMRQLARSIALDADANAPVISGLEISPWLPLRRGPDKKGSSSSGPIKGNVFAQESQKVPYSWLVISPAWYSHFVEYGTQPHDMPRKPTKKGMIFPGRKGKVITKGRKKGTIGYSGNVTPIKSMRHRHPGVRGKGRKPFMRPAADRAEQVLQRILSQMK